MKGTITITIDKPIEDIWAFVSKIENMDEWVDGVSEPRRDADGDVHVGSTFSSKYTYAGKTYDISYEVTVYDPPNHFGMKSTEGPFPFEGWVDLKSMGSNQTEITNTIEAGSDSFATTVVFTLFKPIIRWMMSRQLHKELVILKNKLES